ncbi:MAG: hypothetical protein ACJ75L_10700 [Gaiellaceae bacterium]
MTKAEREEMEARHARSEARYKWLQEHIAKRHAREARREQQAS